MVTAPEVATEPRHIREEVGDEAAGPPARWPPAGAGLNTKAPFGMDFPKGLQYQSGFLHSPLISTRPFYLFQRYHELLVMWQQKEQPVLNPAHSPTAKLCSFLLILFSKEMAPKHTTTSMLISSVKGSLCLQTDGQCCRDNPPVRQGSGEAFFN